MPDDTPLKHFPAIMRAAHESPLAFSALSLLVMLVLFTVIVSTEPDGSRLYLALSGFFVITLLTGFGLWVAMKQSRQAGDTDRDRLRNWASNYSNTLYYALEGYINNANSQEEQIEAWATLLMMAARVSDGENAAAADVRRAFANGVFETLRPHKPNLIPLINERIEQAGGQAFPI